MGSLAGLYISQSFQSLVHFATNATASATLTELQDGLGNGLGVLLNTQGDISSSNLYSNGLDIVGDTNLNGKVSINTNFSSSTIPYYNSYDPFYSNAVRVTGSYSAAGGYPASLEDVKVGWKVNGIGITNATVTSITIVSPTDRYFFVDQCCPAASQYYTFTGAIKPSVDITGSLVVTENLIISGTFDIEGRVRINDNVQVTGSVDISNNITASNAAFRNKLKVDTIEEYTSNSGVTILSNVKLAQNVDVTGSLTASAAFIETDLIVSGTIFAREVHTLIESSSIIFSTGSNILGDSVNDTQTLNGKVIVSGSEEITGSLQVSNDISSSTINGIGNVTTYSASVDYRLDNLETYSGSAEQKFAAIALVTASLNNYTASQDQKNAAIATFTGSTYVTFSQSVDFRLDELESWSSSLQTNFATTAELTQTASLLQNNINTKLDTASFNSYSSSTINTINSLSTSIQITDNAQTIRINGLSLFTGSASTTGSNTFVGNQTISGSLNGSVITLSVVSNTASMDLNLGNFFILNLPSSSTTFLNPTNIKPGQTTQLLIKQPSTTGSIAYPANMLFPTGSDYSASIIANSSDILSFISFTTESLYGVSVKTLV